jgi:hypothetical protein
MLTVIYDEPFDKKKDDAIIAAMKPLGYRFKDSGYNFIDNVRDIRFIQKEKE